MGGVRNEGELIGWHTARYRSADMTVRTVGQTAKDERRISIYDLCVFY